MKQDMSERTERDLSDRKSKRSLEPKTVETNLDETEKTIRLRPVYISWLDHSSFDDQSWRPHEEIEDLEGGVLAHTMGWLTREDDDFYYVVFTVTSQQFSGCMAIMKSAVKDFFKLPLDELSE